MQTTKKPKPAFTLVEVLVASSIFTVIGLIALNLFTTMLRSQARMTVENELYEDARFLLVRLRRDIENNAIDYEEYFNKNLLSNPYYGQNYGCYAAQFYNPGKRTDNNPDTLGALCGAPRDLQDQPVEENPNCTIYKPSFDINTGTNPFLGSTDLPTASSALCNTANGTTHCTTNLIYPKNELYLISPDGMKKTIYAKKIVNQNPQEFALAKLIILGVDQQGDGIADRWRSCGGTNALCCETGFDCNILPGENLEKTLTDINLLNKGFIPISSQKSQITRLDFSILPIEDPNKAFAEPDSQNDPKVILTIGLKPTEATAKSYGVSDREIPELILQTTINTKITTEIPSFLGRSTPIGCPLPTQTP